MWSSGSWLATGLLGLALVPGAAAPAAATWTQPVLSVSRDGQHWASDLGTPLFPGTRSWVPGDSEAVTLWLRDLSGRAGLVDLSLTGDTGHGGDGALSIRIDGAPRDGRGSHLVRLQPASGPTRVDVEVLLPRATGNAAQRLRQQVFLQVRLVADPAVASELPGLSEPVSGSRSGTVPPPFALPLTVLALGVAVRAAVIALRGLPSWGRRTPSSLVQEAAS